MRSTRTWSPMSSVLTIEAEGISKFWKMKVMTKRPMARTVQMEARDSRGVSVWSCCWVDSRSFASVATVSGKTDSPVVQLTVYRRWPDGWEFEGRNGGSGGRAVIDVHC